MLLVCSLQSSKAVAATLAPCFEFSGHSLLKNRHAHGACSLEDHHRMHIQPRHVTSTPSAVFLIASGRCSGSWNARVTFGSRKRDLDVHAIGRVSSRCDGLFSGIARLAVVFTSLSRCTIVRLPLVLRVKRRLHAKRCVDLEPAACLRPAAHRTALLINLALILIRRDEIGLPDVLGEIDRPPWPGLIEHHERPLRRQAQPPAQLGRAGRHFDIGHPADVLQPVRAAAVIRADHPVVADRVQVRPRRCPDRSRSISDSSATAPRNPRFP